MRALFIGPSREVRRLAFAPHLKGVGSDAMKSDEIEKTHIFYLGSPALALHRAVRVFTKIVDESK